MKFWTWNEQRKFNKTVRSGGATNTIFIVFDLTRPGMELVIYRTQCEHANHYTIDAVKVLLISDYTS
jgi:hypothetical protein